jgi:hypothetical protein
VSGVQSAPRKIAGMLRLLPLLLLTLDSRVHPAAPGPAVDLALKLILDLGGLLNQPQQDQLIDDVLGITPPVAGATANLPRTHPSGGPSSARRDAIIDVARRHGGVASDRAALELAAIVGGEAIASEYGPRAIDGELASALEADDIDAALSLLRSSRPLETAAALHVRGEPALAYVLRREAERPILSRRQTALDLALALCYTGVDVSAPVEIQRSTGKVAPLVLAARFRDAKLCDCILRRAWNPSSAAKALLELVNHGRHRGWSVALSRSLILLPAGGGQRKAFLADVMKAALATSEPVRNWLPLLLCLAACSLSLFVSSLQLRRLHDQALAAKDPRKLIVRALDVSEAMEAWSLPTAAVLVSQMDNLTLLARDSCGRTAVHLAALAGWTRMLSLLRSAASSSGSKKECTDNCRSSTCSPAYFPREVSLAVDIFGRTALHIAQGNTTAGALLSATAPGDREVLQIVSRDTTGGPWMDYGASSSRVVTEAVDTADDGGWDNTVLNNASVGCDFDVVDASRLSASDFASRYLLRSRPLLIRRAMPVSSEWRKAFRYSSLRSSPMADAILAAGEIPYGSQFGVQSLSVKLGAFMDSMDTSSARRTYKGEAVETAVPPPFIFHAFPVKYPNQPVRLAHKDTNMTDVENFARAKLAEQEAGVLHSQGEYRKAILKLDTAIFHLSVVAEDHNAHAQQARCYIAKSVAWLALHQYELALSDAEAAVRANPEARSFGARCSAYLSLGHLAESLRDCNAALRRIDTAVAEMKSFGEHLYELIRAIVQRTIFAS